MSSRVRTKAGVKDQKLAGHFKIWRKCKVLKVNRQNTPKDWIATTNQFIVLMVNQIREEDWMPIQIWTEENLKASHQLIKADQ